MSFLPIEQSNYAARPVLLYEFKRGNTLACYASSDTDVITNGNTYKATSIGDKGVKQKGAAVTDVFEITAARSIDPASWFRYTAPSDTVYVAVRRFHWGDTQAVIVWLGQVVSVTEADNEEVSIKCQAISVSLKRGGLRLTWQRGCVHALYDQNCTVNKSLFGVTGTIASLGPDSFTFNGALLAGHYYAGGIVQWTVDSSGTTEQRLIESATGNSFQPYGQMDGYSVGMTVTLYPGCKRTSSWCAIPFQNLDNYGGYEFMPNRTPYDGDSVF